MLELESGFPGGFSEGFYFAVVDVTTAVEDHVADVGGFGAFGDQGSDALGALDIGL